MFEFDLVNEVFSREALLADLEAMFPVVNEDLDSDNLFHHRGEIKLRTGDMGPLRNAIPSTYPGIQTIVFSTRPNWTTPKTVEVFEKPLDVAGLIPYIETFLKAYPVPAGFTADQLGYRLIGSGIAHMSGYPYAIAVQPWYTDRS